MRSLIHHLLSAKYEVIVGAILLSFGLLVIRESRRLEVGILRVPGPGFFPFWLGCLVAIFSLILLIGFSTGKIKADHGQWKGLLWQKVAIASAVLFAYCFALESIGYLTGTFLLLGILLRLTEKKRILLVIGLSGLITLGTYLIFKQWLFIQLPKGFSPF